MWYKRLEELSLPELISKEEMLDILQREEYGYVPKKTEKINWVIDETFVCGPYYCASKASIKKIIAGCIINGKEFSFPFYFSLPAKEGKLNSSNRLYHILFESFRFQIFVTAP